MKKGKRQCGRKGLVDGGGQGRLLWGEDIWVKPGWWSDIIRREGIPGSGNSRDKGPETESPYRVCEEARRPVWMSTEHNGRVMGDRVGKGLCKRFGFYFHEMPLEGSVRIQKCLNYLNSRPFRRTCTFRARSANVIWKCSKEYFLFKMGLEV